MVKKLTAVLALSLSLMLVSGCATTDNGLSYTPHENPSFAADVLDPVSLLLFYASAMDLTALGQYQDAQDLLADLENANVPEELSLIIKLFNELNRQLTVDLDNLETLLDDASAKLVANCLDEVEQALDEASLLVEGIGQNLDEIEIVLADINENLAGLAGDLGFSQSQERLASAKDKLDGLLASLTAYQQTLVSLNRQAAVELTATQITINVNPTEVFVGDNIMISGKLTAGAASLAGRQVELLIGEASHTVLTTVDGLFTAVISVPYKYVSEMTLKVRYNPSGDDTGIYTAASQTVMLETFFYANQLDVTVPSEIQPGRSFSVEGGMTSTGVETMRVLKVYLDGILLSEELVSSDYFKFDIMPPADLTAGSHTLFFSVAPFGRYSDASQSIEIEVVLVTLEVDIQSPSFIFLPGSIDINGRVHENGGYISGAEVTLVYGDDTFETITSDNGRFAVIIESDFDMFIFGLRQVNITIEPLEPWYAPLEVEISVAVLNPAYIGLAAVAFVSAGVMYRRRRGSPSLPSKRIGFATRGKEDNSAAFYSRKHPQYTITGVSGRMLVAYLKALGAVEKATGIAITPDMTLRGYLKQVEPSLASAQAPFTELTVIAETLMYSNYRPDINEAFKAELLATEVRKGLNSA